MIIETLRVRLVAAQENVGGYIQYVFEDLKTGAYKACTRCPNWDSPFLVVGDIGFLKYREVVAGKDTWYDSENNIQVPYKNTDFYFETFIYEKPPEGEIRL
jgi:hypothetical protein